MREPRGVDVALLVATLAFVLLSVVPLGGYRPWFWIPLSLAAALIFLFSTVCDLTDRRSAMEAMQRLRWPILLFLAVALWGLVQSMDGLPSMLWHPAYDRVESAGRITLDQDRSSQFAMRLISYAMIFWIGCRLGRYQTLANTVLLAVALFGLAYNAYGLMEFAAGSNEIFGVARRTLEPVSAATIESPNSYAFYAGMFLICGTAWLFRSYLAADGNTATFSKAVERSFRIILLLSIPVALVSIWFAGSRAGLANSLAGMAALLLLAFLPPLLRKVTARILLVIAVAVPLVLTVVIAQLSGTSVGTAGLLERAMMFSTGIDMILSGPLAGTGLGTFEIAAEPWKFEELYFYRWDAAHNIFIEHMVEMGPVVALMFWIALALLGWRLSAGFIERRRDNHYAALGLVLFVMAALHNTIDYPLHRPAVVYLFVLLVGVSWAQSWSTASRRSSA
ncbi:MAG: O-antigen ligase family protein [Minwuia sp.]|nr:O-antigen ligase family protein [Minwuia sp.]